MKKKVMLEKTDIITRLNLRVDMVIEGFRFAAGRQPTLNEFSELVCLAAHCEPFIFNSKIKNGNNFVCLEFSVFNETEKIEYSIRNIKLQ